MINVSLFLAIVFSLCASTQSVYAMGNSVQPTPYLMILYGYVFINGQPAPTGTLVQFVTPRLEVAGEWIIDETVGMLKTTHVFGVDGLGTPGFYPGEPIGVYINGRKADFFQEITWQNNIDQLFRVDINLEVDKENLQSHLFEVTGEDYLYIQWTPLVNPTLGMPSRELHVKLTFDEDIEIVGIEENVIEENFDLGFSGYGITLSYRVFTDKPGSHPISIEWMEIDGDYPASGKETVFLTKNYQTFLPIVTR